MMRPLVVLLACATLPLAGQHPLAGSWKLSYAVGARMDNGVRTEITGTGTLMLRLEGDSLVGELVTDPMEGYPQRPPIRMAGRASGGTVSLISRSTGKVNMNGDEHDVTAISTWTLAVRGDSVSGTVSRELEGVDLPPMPAAPVTGVRAGT